MAPAAAVALLVGIMGLKSLGTASDSAQEIYTDNVASMRAVGQIRAMITEARLDAANQALSTDAASVEKFEQAFEEDRRAFAAAMTAYRSSGPAGDASVADQLQSQWDTYADLARNQLLPGGATRSPNGPESAISR